MPIVHGAETKQILEDKLNEIVDSYLKLFSDIKPSEWTEANRVMSDEVSPIPGPFRYSYTPYMREIVNRVSANDPSRIIVVMKSAQIGFALDLTTPIFTTKGWKVMADIGEGDFVFDEKGIPCEVIKVSEILYGRDCLDVHFTDGEIIRCDADHLWVVNDLEGIRRTLSTSEIKNRVKQTRRDGKVRSRYSIPNNGPIQFPAKELPIDPYLLGLWLGDGATSSNRITANINDAKEYELTLLQRGIKVKIIPYKDQPQTVHMNVQNAFNVWKGGFNYYGNKHIPLIYKTASVSQRLELIQGLIDTDGHVMKDGKVEFYNINEELILDVKEIISSLGYKVTIRKRKNIDRYTTIVPGRRYKMKPLFVLNFMGTREMPVAKLRRKSDRLRSNESIRGEINKKWIREITPCESVPVKCISIDSETHLYLAGRTFIPTHNSTGVIESAIGYIISQQPGNILFLSGAQQLSEEAMNGKIDQMIDSCGLRHLIRPNVMRKRNQRTGDTAQSKEFPGGSLIAGSASNHKLLRQRSVRYGFIDDFDGAKKSSKESGSTRTLIQQRFAAYYHKMKLFYISTPELKSTSNIEPAFLLGDQRRYFVPCPCCGVYIPLFWTVPIEGSDSDEKGGISWELDENDKLIPESVKYVCQSCGNSFDDSKKSELIGKGEWKPTAQPSEEGYYSYHISCLYAPPGMYDWAYYVRQYLEANPKGGRRKEELHKTFLNVALGETYEQEGEAPEATSLMKNIRKYDIGTVPEKISIADKNGRIVLLTCACDLNGTENDARLDYEVVAWSEAGTPYSVTHGSIGTFVPRENSLRVKQVRERWTYEHHKANSVWPEFHKIIQAIYMTDVPTPTAEDRFHIGRRMKIAITGVDTGHYTDYAYAFVDQANSFGSLVIGLKGDKESKFRKFDADTASFRASKERGKLYLVDVNFIKDQLADAMRLNWKEGADLEQPVGFRNFPVPSGGKYLYDNFFSHYESEHKINETKDGESIGARWVKKSNLHQNHAWDLAIYGMVLKDIVTDQVTREAKIKRGTWADLCGIFFPDSK